MHPLTELENNAALSKKLPDRAAIVLLLTICDVPPQQATALPIELLVYNPGQERGRVYAKRPATTLPFTSSRGWFR